MEKKITVYWQKLNMKYSSSQVFFILIYWVFMGYQNVRKKRNIAKIQEYRSGLLSMLEETMNYDLKESTVRLSDLIQWDLLEIDYETQRLLEAFLEDMERFFLYSWRETDENREQEQKALNNLDYLIDMLLEMAEIDGLFFTTPKSIRQVIQGLFQQVSVRNMADFCCGSGCLGISVWEQLKEPENVSYYGMDIEPVMCDIARIMAYFHGISQNVIVLKDVLEYEKECDNQKYDLILLDVPRGNNQNILVHKEDVRLKALKQRNIFSDWYHVMNVLYALSDVGRAAAVVTAGTLTRNNESELRRMLIEKDWIEAVITLPANLYPNTRTGSEIIIFHKRKEQKRKNKILFMDVSRKYYRENRNFYTISEEGIRLVQDIYHQYFELESISVIQNISAIEENGYSLKPLFYVSQKRVMKQTHSKLCLKDIANISRGVQLKKEEELLLCQNGDAFYLNIKDIQNGCIDFKGARKITAKNRDWHEKFQIQQDDILITSKGASFKIAIVDEEPPETFICGNLTLIRVNRDIYHPYVLFSYLTSAEGLMELEGIQSGTTIRVLNNANLRELPVPQYNKELMNSVGNQLQEKRKQYYKEMNRLTEDYKKEKQVLLELIGI